MISYILLFVGAPPRPVVGIAQYDVGFTYGSRNGLALCTSNMPAALVRRELHHHGQHRVVAVSIICVVAARASAGVCSMLIQK
eukprot:scaffold249_cov132-Isochrysis_galbana.AAC.10